MRAALTQWRCAVVLMEPICQSPMTARTAPTLIEYDKIVRDLPALANGAVFLRAPARSNCAIAMGLSCPIPFDQNDWSWPSFLVAHASFFSSMHCNLDHSSGEALCTRELLELLAARVGLPGAHDGDPRPRAGNGTWRSASLVRTQRPEQLAAGGRADILRLTNRRLPGRVPAPFHRVELLHPWSSRRSKSPVVLVGATNGSGS